MKKLSISEKINSIGQIERILDYFEIEQIAEKTFENLPKFQKCLAIKGLKKDLRLTIKSFVLNADPVKA